MNIQVDEAKIRAIFAKYGAAEMRSEISVVLAKINETNRKKIEKFKSAVGKKFQIVFKNALPKDVLIYAPVLLTEYGNTRIFEAGCSKIERINDDFDQLASIDFKAAVPIFFDKKSGEISFTIEKQDRRKYEIKSKLKKVKGNKTTYENNVVFKNEVFDFSASEIEVVKINDNYVKIIIKK
ncbi:MAG TPA: hypothetical protein PKK26_06195 [Candidatus Wallbacteria bacterium]|nr:hypothetical protein [Candidatus Wallbacteria bacterium]